MRVTVNFSLKRSKSRADGKCPVYVRCTMKNQRFELSTGIFVVPESWNDSRQLITGKTEEAKILNNRLDKVNARVQDIYNQLESKGEPFSALHVKNKLLGVSHEKGVLFLHSIAYVLLHTMQKQVFKGAEYANATFKTIQNKIFKTAAWAKEMKTKIKVEFMHHKRTAG